MQQLVEEVLEQARGSWRFRWSALAVAWIVGIIAWIGTLFIPDSYEASARVYVDVSTQLKPLLQGLAVDQDVDAQLSMVQKALLSGPQLEKVAHSTQLDALAKTPSQKERVVQDLLSKIVITVDNGPDHSKNQLYTISYQNPNREASLAVVRSLVDTFMADSKGSNRSGSAVAQRFLKDQIGDLEQKLAEAEARLADFKKKNVGMVPGQGGDYFTRVQTETDALRQAQTQLSVLESQKQELLRQLRGEAAVVPADAATAGGAAAHQADKDLDSRIKEAEARLDDLLLRYTDKHPEVIALRETIVELKRRREQEIEALRRGGAGSGSLNVTSNPVYQSIQIQLHKVEVDIAALRGDIGNREQGIAELKRLINSAPEVEAQLARLNRDYGITKAQYDALVDRLQKAHLSEQASETGIVNFQVIDPPRASLGPVAPNRPLLSVVVLVAALAAGAGCAYLRNQLSPVFANAASLAQLTGKPVLGTVGVMWQADSQSAARGALLRFSSAAALLFVALVVAALLQSRAAMWIHSFHG